MQIISSAREPRWQDTPISRPLTFPSSSPRGVWVRIESAPVCVISLGAGIGAAWAFVLQRVMSGAKEGEENTAAASAATVQQAGFALGAAVAGLVANASGLDNGLDLGSVAHASLWVPLALVAAPLAAGAIGARLNLMVPRSPKQGLPAAGYH